MEKIKTNSLWFGVFLGTLVPVITFFLVYLIREGENNFWVFIESLYYLRVLPKLISLCLLPNLLVFFVFLHFDLQRSARGVILSLFIFAIPVLILKFQ